MELYLDSANPSEISAAFQLGIFHGLTTTPTFLKRQGITNVDHWLLETAKQVPIIQIEALGNSAQEIVNEANRLLERPYRFSGRVVRGRGLGRQLSWPTANLQVDGRKFLPQEGVYAAWVRNLEPAEGGEALQPCGAPMAAVMNLGPQPTVDPLAPSAVEVHLLDRDLELVGRDLEVEPVQLLRRQQRFAGLEELSCQIGVDAALARSLLNRSSAGGVGVAQTPADEGGDAPEQQNS